MYINRKIDLALTEWKADPEHKPLLLRGARQTGKTTAIRHLAESFDTYLEVNFESDRSVHAIFDGDIDIPRIIAQLEIQYRKPIVPGKTLVFFDEIQECPRAITALRFFYEKAQQLHVAAAGSLLEFVFEELSDFGVGRIRNIFVHPFTFAEFATAIGDERALTAARNAGFSNPVPQPVHSILLEDLKKFLIVGGMPQAVNKYVSTGSLLAAQQEQDDILTSLKADFAKYKTRVAPERIRATLASIARQTGEKFTFTDNINGLQHRQVKTCADLLVRSKLAIHVRGCYANGLPLGGDVNDKNNKFLLFDTGLYMRERGFDASEWISESPDRFVNQGKLGELFVGLELKKSGSPFTDNELFYWHRDKNGATAEVDYITQYRNHPLPIEVKSGSEGKMKSLHILMDEKRLPLALRTSEENFCTYDTVRVIPLYMIGEWRDFIGA